MAERVKAEDAEKIKNLIKNLRDESELYEWLIHTKKQIRVANDLLEVVEGDHIMNETMKRYFLRGNKKGEGIEALEKYLEKDEKAQKINFNLEKKGYKPSIDHNAKIKDVDLPLGALNYRMFNRESVYSNKN